MDSNTLGQQHRHRHFWTKLVAIVVLVGALGFFTAHAEPVHAEAPHPPAFPSVDQVKGSASTYHPTAREAAIAADKAQLSEEYVNRVLTGKETLATYETHYRAFMVKWNLGNVANLHAAPRVGAARLQSGKTVTPYCPSVVTGSPNVTCPVWRAQFPEENWNWCGPATLSTTLVEDSWSWPGTNQYGGHTLTYDAYHITQPSQTAYDDEYWLATHGVISGDIQNNGASVDQMTTVVVSVCQRQRRLVCPGVA